MRRHGLSATATRAVGGHDFEKFEVTVEDPGDYSVTLPNGELVRCNFPGSMTQLETTPGRREITLSDRPQIVIEPAKPDSFEHLWSSVVAPLDDLFNFASGLKSGWTEVRLLGDKQPDTKWPTIHHSETVSVESVEVTSRTKPVFHIDCWNFDTVVAQWCGLWGNYRDAIGKGLAARHERFANEQVRLYAMALEGLAGLSAAHANEPFTRSDRKRIRALLDPEFDKTQIDALLLAARGTTMQMKLDAHIAMLEADGIAVPGEIAIATPDIKRLRNRESHGDGTKRPLDVQAVRRANLAASALFEAIVLYELGDANELEMMRSLVGRRLGDAAESIRSARAHDEQE